MASEVALDAPTVTYVRTHSILSAAQMNLSACKGESF